jgi:hypothetical protein
MATFQLAVIKITNEIVAEPEHHGGIPFPAAKSN